jgi:hypothetical protein
MTGDQDFERLQAIGDGLMLALRAHRAVVIALHDRIDLRTEFDDRVGIAIDAFYDRIASANADSVGMVADLRRHLAILLAYQARPTRTTLSEDELGAAATEYAKIDDLHGRSRTYYLRGSLRRSWGLAEAKDDLAAAGEIRGTGFDFAVGVIAAELGLVAAAGGSADDDAAELVKVGEELRRNGQFREVSYVKATLGMLAVKRGDIAAAVGAFEDARECLSPANYHGDADLDARGGANFYRESELERLIDVVINEHRLALVYRSAGLFTNALDAALSAIDAVQQVPAGWYAASRRDDPFHEPFQQLYQLAIALCGSVGRDAAEGCIRIIEIAKRSSLAGLIRRAAIDHAMADVRRDAIRDGTMEEAVVLRPIRETVKALDRTIGPLASNEILVQLSDRLGVWLAEACFPDQIDAQLIRDRLARARHRESDVLVVFEDPTDRSSLRGSSVFMPFDGPAELRAFTIGAADRRFIECLRTPPAGQRDAFAMSPVSADPDVWERIGAAVLPDALRDRTPIAGDDVPRRELLVSPSGLLAYVPWAAVGIGSSRRLVQVADIAIVPSLTLVSPQRGHAGSTAFVAGLATHYRQELFFPARTIQRAWEAADVEPRLLETRRDALALLQACPPDGGLFIAAHGQGEGGLSQCLKLADGDITAWAAFDYAWPKTVVLTSCHVAGVELEAGVEPFALSLVCLASGADEFVAGVHEVVVNDNRVLHETLANGLTRGESAVRALNLAQRSALERYAEEPVAYWAGLQVVVSS